MDAGPEKVGKKQLSKGSNSVTSQNNRNYGYNRFIFTDCGNIKPDEVIIKTNLENPDWQIGFYDADGEVYFKKVKLGNGAVFSSLVRNYWWNGQDGSEKKEGYYSLIKAVEVLEVETEGEGYKIGWCLAQDLADYVEGKYKVDGNWKLCELNRNMEIKIVLKGNSLALDTVKRLRGYFNKVSINNIYTPLQIENVIGQECENQYIFSNSRRTTAQKLVINAMLVGINNGCTIIFNNADNEVHIPEIIMGEKGSFASIVRNHWKNNKEGDEKKDGYYSLVQHVETFVIRNNPQALKDLADYVAGRYKIGYSNWKLQQLSKDIKVVIEESQDAFLPVSRIQNYFTDVVVDGRKPEEYLAAWEPWNNLDYKAFVNCFKAYGLIVDLPECPVDAAGELVLEDCYDIRGPINSIDSLTIRQKMGINSVVCFNDTSKSVVAQKIVIESGGDLRCILQNACYNGTDAGFFSLLRTTKELEIRSNHARDNQVLVDLADYIERKYTLNVNWKQEELDRDMRINIGSGGYSLSLNIARRLRNYFRSVSIDRIYTPLQIENIIDQECGDKHIFSDSKEANPQKLVINAKLMGSGTLILFNQADGEVHIPQITINEQGSFAAIVRNHWWNNKEGDEEKSGLYSLVQHAETLAIRNNPKVLEDLADYVVGKYEIGYSRWKLQQLNKNIKVTIEGPKDAFLPVLRISNYFNEVTVDGKQPENYLATWESWNDPDYKAFRTCFGEHRLLVEPIQYGIKFQNMLKLVECVYNIRKSVDSIDLLTVRQKLDTDQFVCFHDVDKPVIVNEILIDDDGDLRSVLQNAYYNNSQAGFFSLLEAAKKLEIHNNVQAVEDLLDYVDGKYALHPKWRIQTLNRNMEIKIRHDNRAFSLDVAIRLRNYFRSVSIDCIRMLLETESVIDQECEDKYVFTNSRDANPQKLVVNAKLAGNNDLILFNGADGNVCIPEITIGEHGNFDAIVRNEWRNCKYGSESRYGYYSLISYVETLNIQNNPQVVQDLDSCVSRNYWVRGYDWEVQKLSENMIVRINGVSGLDEQINKLKDYFSFIFVDDRKALGNSRQQMLTHINLISNDIRQRQVQNKQKQQSIDNSVTSIQDTKRRIERARARLGRRRARFQEYLALAE